MRALANKIPVKLKRQPKSKARFVLSVGDEGGILIYLVNGKVERRLFALNSDPDNVRDMEALLRQDEKAPISLLVDMIDQTYVRQSLPPVSMLSVGNLMRKRLDRDFAPDDVKGAIQLGREKEGRKDWQFMMVALANTSQLQGWLKLVLDYPNRFEGIFLAPIESYTLLKQLSAHACAEEGRKPANWQMLVLHSKVGGFRQVVFKEGKILFTRLAQPIGELVPEVVAGNIEQEAQNTIEYIKRLSYTDQDVLEVYIVASQEITKSIDSTRIKATHVTTFTPFEAGEALNISQAALPGDSFADVVLAASFGLQRKHQLKLTTPYINALDQWYKLRSGIRAGAAVVMAGALLFSIYMLISIFPKMSEISLHEKDGKVLTNDISLLESESAKLPSSLQSMMEVISAYEFLLRSNYDPLKTMAKISETLMSGVLISQLDWSLKDVVEQQEDTNDGNTQGLEAKPEPDIVLTMNTEFDNTDQNINNFIKKANAYIDRVKGVFSDFDVTHGKLPGTVGADETFQTSLGSQQNSVVNAGQSIYVEVRIEGPIADKAATDGAQAPQLPPPSLPGAPQ